MTHYFQLSDLPLIIAEADNSSSPIFANQSTPYNNLDDRRFEELVYLLFKQKMAREQDFLQRHNRIQLMQGVGEKGRDGALFKGNIFSGIVQCKNLKNPIDPLSCLDEIIKPFLHAVIGNLSIPQSGSFEYFL